MFMCVGANAVCQLMLVTRRRKTETSYQTQTENLDAIEFLHIKFADFLT